MMRGKKARVGGIMYEREGRWCGEDAWFGVEAQPCSYLNGCGGNGDEEWDLGESGDQVREAFRKVGTQGLGIRN